MSSAHFLGYVNTQVLSCRHTRPASPFSHGAGATTVDRAGRPKTALCSVITGSPTGPCRSTVCGVSSSLGGHLSAWTSQHYTDSGAHTFCPQPPPGPGMDKQPFRANDSRTTQLTHWTGHAPGWDRQHRKCEKQASLPLAAKQRKPAWLLLPV